MTHARIFLMALSVLGLAVGGIAASSAQAPRGNATPFVETRPAADGDVTESCPADEPATGSLLAAGTAPNSSCPPPKTCCHWKDPGRHICDRCC